MATGLAKSLAICGLAMLVLAAGTASAAETIGEVERVEEDAFGTPPAQDRRELRLADNVQRDELVETLDRGELSIRFADGTQLALGANSAVVLDEMVYADDAGEAFRIDLGEGLFHFVSGSLDASRVTIATPVSTIGIRGTDVAILVLPDGTTSLAVLEGLAVMTAVAGGPPAEVAANRTGTVLSGVPGVTVVDGLAGFAGEGLPAVGPAPSTDSAGMRGGNAERERQTVAAAPAAPSGGDGGDNGGANDGGGSGGDNCSR